MKNKEAFLTLDRHIKTLGNVLEERGVIRMF